MSKTYRVLWQVYDGYVKSRPQSFVIDLDEIKSMDFETVREIEEYIEEICATEFERKVTYGTINSNAVARDIMKDISNER